MRTHKEKHKIGSVGWLRAAVLGANDGIVSTSSLVLGVAASHASHGNILVAGIAGLVSGAMSMAAGEYISVHSQADTEKSALEQERRELSTDPRGELTELTNIYVKRGLQPELARQVAEQLTAHNALEAHTRDELGLTDELSARPLQAALSSAGSFAIGAVIPLLVAAFTPANYLVPLVAVTALLALASLGGVAAKIGGAKMMPGVLRVTFWSALAMLLTYFAGAIFGATV